MLCRTFVCIKMDAVSMLVFTLSGCVYFFIHAVLHSLMNKETTYLRLCNDLLHIAISPFAMEIAAGNAALVTLRHFVCWCCLPLWVNHSRRLVFKIVSLRSSHAPSKETESGWKEAQLGDAFDVTSPWDGLRNASKSCWLFSSFSQLYDVFSYSRSHASLFPRALLCLTGAL